MPAQRVRKDAEVSIALCSLYLLFGIALLAMSFNLVQEEVISNVKSVARNLGIIKDESDDDDDYWILYAQYALLRADWNRTGWQCKITLNLKFTATWSLEKAVCQNIFISNEGYELQYWNIYNQLKTLHKANINLYWVD